MNIQKRNQALNNAINSLTDNGLEATLKGYNLFWVEVESPHDSEYFLGFNEVEFAFPKDWYLTKEKEMRGKRGNVYWDACAELAKSLKMKDQVRAISYTAKQLALSV